MAIVRTAKGTASAYDDTVGVDRCELASVSIAEGASIVVMVAHQPSFGAPSTVTWNGLALAQDVAAVNASGSHCRIYSRHGVSAATGTVTVLFGSTQIAGVCIAVAQYTGLAASPVDMASGGTGLGVSPSSGATSTTAQADEVCVGAVASALAGLDVGGTWDNSFTAGQAVNDANTIALSEGYRIVAATGAYTASKTLANSGQWAAVITTYKALGATAWTKSLADTVTASDALGKSVGKAVADTVSATDALGKHPTKPIADTVSASDLMNAAGAHVAGLSDTVSATDEATRAVGKVADDTITASDVAVPSLTGFFPGGGAVGSVESITDPWSGVPFTNPETLYHQAQVGMVSCGSPYFAAIQNNTFNSVGQGGGEFRLSMIVALRGLPVQLASPDEVHILFSVHEAVPGGSERVAIGVTPNGRVVGRTGTRADLLSPPASLLADGLPHRIWLQCFAAGASRQVGLDGAVLAQDAIPGGVDGLFSPTGLPIRYMAFNGVDGRTRCNCVISHVELVPVNAPIAWLFNEAQGVLVKDYEMYGDPAEWTDRATLPAGASDWNDGNDFDLTAQWYDPTTMGRPLLWGAVPTSPIQTCLSWSKATQYVPGGPNTPAYQRVPVQ